MPACAREEPGMNVIEARGLTKVYGGRAVVSDFAMTCLLYTSDAADD